MKAHDCELQHRMLGVEDRVSLAPCIIVVLESLIVLRLSE